MKSNELRIGNYVSFMNNETFRVNSVFEKVIHDENYNGYGCNEIYGIPLTEEWLINFGFEKTEEKSFSIKINSRGIINVYVRDIVELELGNKSGYSFGYADVNFIHELQNLYFALTKKELKIK